MATKLANQASAGVQPKVLRVGLVGVTATYSLDASLSNGDVIQMLKVPANAKVKDLYVSYMSNGQGSMIVGDGVDTDRYIAATLISVGGQAVTRLGGPYVPYTYSVDDTIDVTISTSVQPSSGAIYMEAIIEIPGP